MGRSSRQSRSSLLPPGSGEFFRLRATEVGGICLVIVGVLAFAAGLTYNPADPSSNNASDLPATNFLGELGATLSDFLIQSLGLTAFAIPLVLLAWGWRLFRAHRLPRWALRIALMPFGLMLCPALKVRRSLAKAKSFSLAGSTFANIGMLRRISTSFSMDIVLSPRAPHCRCLFLACYSAASIPCRNDPDLPTSSS